MLLEDHFAHTEMSKKYLVDLGQDFIALIGSTFLVCLQSHPLTCSSAEMVSCASQNLVAGPPLVLGCKDAIFVFRLSAVCSALLLLTEPKQLEKPTWSKMLTPLFVLSKNR